MTVEQDKISSCVKDLPQRIQTASFVERKVIFDDLVDLVKTTELPENIVKVSNSETKVQCNALFTAGIV